MSHNRREELSVLLAPARNSRTCLELTSRTSHRSCVRVHTWSGGGWEQFARSTRLEYIPGQWSGRRGGAVRIACSQHQARVHTWSGGVGGSSSHCMLAAPGPCTYLVRWGTVRIVSTQCWRQWPGCCGRTGADTEAELHVAHHTAVAVGERQVADVVPLALAQLAVARVDQLHEQYGEITAMKRGR